MPNIIPKPRWAYGSLNTPFRMGNIKRPKPGQTLAVDAETANWLEINGYAAIVDSVEVEPVSPAATEAAEETESAESIAAPIESTESLPEASEQATAASALEPWQDIALELFNTAEAETILQTIKGIGPRKVDELINARPLRWEVLAAMLNDRQMQAVSKWANDTSLSNPAGS